MILGLLLKCCVMLGVCLELLCVSVWFWYFCSGCFGKWYAGIIGLICIWMWIVVALGFCYCGYVYCCCAAFLLLFTVVCLLRLVLCV